MRRVREVRREVFVAPRLDLTLPDGFSREPPRDGPAVSIITVALNAAPTIRATLESVAAQTWRDLEHVVVDGGSTDSTCQLARDSGLGVRLVSEPDHGIYDAFNRGLALARGRWITFLNADDVYAHPRVLESVMDHADRAPAVGLFHADMDWVDETGRVVFEGRFLGGGEDPGFDLEMPFHHPTVFVARAVYERLGGFDATFRLAGDFDFLLRAYLAGVRFQHVRDVWVRMSTRGRSEQQPLTGAFEMMRSWRLRTGRLPWRRLLRFTKVEVLDVHAPVLSKILGAIKRAAGGRALVRSRTERGDRGPG